MSRVPAHAGPEKQSGEPDRCTASSRDAHRLGSSLQHLLSTNEPPLESEAIIIRDDYLRNAEKRALDLDEKLWRISNTWKELAEQRIEVQKSIESNRAILSPIRTLPNDIIYEILLRVPWYPNYDPLDLSEPPWVLTRICSRWRSIALSMSSLWSCMTVSDYEGTRMQKNPSSLLQTALVRSGNQKLTIQYFCSAMPLPVQETLMAAFVDHSSRWEDVHFSMPVILAPTLSQVRGRLQSLRDLTLWTESSILDIFEDCPKLRTVSLSGPPISHSAKLPWSQLTSLRIHKGRSDEFIAILRESPKLETLAILCRVKPASVPTILVHTSLNHLEVSGGGQLLRSLQLPALQYVSIRAPITTETSRCHYRSLPDLMGLIQRSGCELRVLALRDVVMDDNLQIALQAVPSLAELSITISEFTADDDECLSGIVSASSPVLLPETDVDADELHLGPLIPCLEKLTIFLHEEGEFVKRKVEFVDSTFVEMVKARWHIRDTQDIARPTPTLNRLKAVHLVLYSRVCAEIEIDEDGLALLSRFEEEGLNICIRAGNPIASLRPPIVALILLDPGQKFYVRVTKRRVETI